MLQRRLHVRIDDERHERLLAIAREREMSVGAVVREAIDRGLASPGGRRQAAGARILSAPPMEVPESVDELIAEVKADRAIA